MRKDDCKQQVSQLEMSKQRKKKHGKIKPAQTQGRNTEDGYDLSCSLFWQQSVICKTQCRWRKRNTRQKSNLINCTSKKLHLFVSVCVCVCMRASRIV